MLDSPVLLPEFGEALAELRRRRGVPRRQLARRAEITESMLSSYEKGRRYPSLPTLVRLLAAIESDFEDLDAALRRVQGLPPKAAELGTGEIVELASRLLNLLRENCAAMSCGRPGVAAAQGPEGHGGVGQAESPI